MGVGSSGVSNFSYTSGSASGVKGQDGVGGSGVLATFGAVDPYSANGFSPDFVADESLATPYYRVSGSTSDYDTVYTSDTGAGGLATMNDSSGSLVWGPHNLLLRSQEFNSSWNQTNLTVGADAGTAPDGATTADAYIPASGSVSTYIRQVRSGNAAGQYTFRVFLKAGTLSGLWVELSLNTSADRAWFDLENGVKGTATGVVAHEIYSAPNGYYLCEIVVDVAAGNFEADIAIRPGDGSTGNITGDGSSSAVLMWGAHVFRSDLGGMASVLADQRVAGSETYVPTTTAARYLIRRRHYRYNGTSYVPTLLHEPVGATNLCPFSNDFSNWSIRNTDALTVTTDQGVGPDGNNSLDLLEITDTTNEVHGIFRNPGDGGNPSASNQLLAAHVRDDDQRYVALRAYIATNDWVVVVFDLQAGTITQESTGSGTTSLVDSGIIDCGGGLYRCWMSFSDSANGVVTAEEIMFVSSGTPTLATINGEEAYSGTAGVGLYAGFVDIVSGASVPSSHIPTTGASVTRSADTCKVKAAALPYDATAVTMLLAGRLDVLAPTTRVLSWWASTAERWLLYASGNSFIASGGASEFAVAIDSSTGFNLNRRIAARAVANSEIQSALNGTANPPQSATMPTTMPAVSSADLQVLDEAATTLGPLNGRVDKIILWAADIAEAGIEEATSA